jgi:hypothetical protein
LRFPGLSGHCQNAQVVQRLSLDDVACWVLKSRRPPQEIDPGWRSGSRASLQRCLRLSYRVELMQAGQPCLLWLSGQNEPGVHAIGTLAGDAVVQGMGEAGGREATVTVSLLRLQEPLPRRGLLADPVFAGAEVLRMPAGSNPSYLSPDRLAALVEHLRPADVARSGWAGW